MRIYPMHTIALCCFDNARAQRAKPLLKVVRAARRRSVGASRLDCHTCGAPDLEVGEEVDHWVLFGTDEATGQWGELVDYWAGMRHRLREYLPDSVVGCIFGGRLPNGDFTIDHEERLSGGRQGPPSGAPVGLLGWGYAL
jgi:hypothetical protein